MFLRFGNIKIRQQVRSGRQIHNNFNMQNIAYSWVVAILLHPLKVFRKPVNLHKGNTTFRS